MALTATQSNFAEERWCTKSTFSAQKIFKNHSLWFKNIKSASHIPYIKFNKDFTFKSHKKYGQWVFDELSMNYKRGDCSILAAFYVEGSVYLDQFIFKGTELRYGEEIHYVSSNRHYYGADTTVLRLKSELGTFIFTILQGEKDCSAGDLSLAAKKLGITFYFFHPEDAKDCREFF